MWRPWLYNPGTSDQIAGFVKEYSHIAFATVKVSSEFNSTTEIIDFVINTHFNE